LDDDLQEVLRMLSQQKKDTPQDLSLEQQRSAFEEGGLAMPLPDEPHDIVSVSLGDIPCMKITPKAATAGKAILYFHGGGYVVGSSLSHRHLMARIAIDAGVTLWSVDYRLAPEHAFPASVDDGLAAFSGLCRIENLSPADIVVAGDSAGGGLAMSLILALRDAGDALPAGSVLLSPWLDLTASTKSYVSRASSDPMLTKEQLLYFAGLYQGSSQAAGPSLSPIHSDLAGLPQLYVQVGDKEILLDDSQLIATRALGHGVSARIDVYPDMFHVFQYFWPMLPQAREAIKRLGGEIQRMLLK
jgi:monoterpene epsilon-lactone hydrolase